MKEISVRRNIYRGKPYDSCENFVGSNLRLWNAAFFDQEFTEPFQGPHLF